MTARIFLLAQLLAGAAILPCGSVGAQTASPGVIADVLARPVQRGDLISARDFAAAEISAAQARGAVSRADADGLEARRALPSGMPVRNSDLIEPRLVRRGEPVTISLRSGALSITATGRALADGALGEPVRVFSEATNQTLDAVVEGAGVVRVTAR